METPGEHREETPVEAVIALSGDLGSGKTAVSEVLASRLRLRRVSTGDLQRSIAQELGMTTLELNQYSETHPEIDDRIDGMLRDMERTGEAVILDSRLAWHFVPSAFKVHLVVDPTTAAERILSRPGGAVEEYASVDEAIAKLTARRESERKRFVDLYDIDITRWRNYDLVIDTTQASIDEVAGTICEVLDEGVPPGERPALRLAPHRLLPTADAATLDVGETAYVEAEIRREGFDCRHPVAVGRSGSTCWVVEGHTRLSSALRAECRLVPATLVAEDGEMLAGRPADEVLAESVRPAWVRRWESLHGFTFTGYEASG